MREELEKIAQALGNLPQQIKNMMDGLEKIIHALSKRQADVCTDMISLVKENQDKLKNFGEDINTAKQTCEKIQQDLKIANQQLSKLLPEEMLRRYDNIDVKPTV